MENWREVKASRNEFKRIGLLENKKDSCLLSGCCSTVSISGIWSFPTPSALFVLSTPITATDETDETEGQRLKTTNSNPLRHVPLKWSGKMAYHRSTMQTLLAIVWEHFHGESQKNQRQEWRWWNFKSILPIITLVGGVWVWLRFVALSFWAQVTRNSPTSAQPDRLGRKADG